MILHPDQYSQASVTELLEAAARGHAGLDHRWLKAILAHGDAVLPEGLRFYSERDSGDRVNMPSVLLDLARQLRGPSGVQILALMAQAHDYELPDVLTEAFIELGAEAIDTLLALHRQATSEEIDASDLAFALASMGVRDQRILDLLLKDLEEYPLEAAINLAAYGDVAAKPALEAALAAAADESVRFSLAKALEELGTRERDEPTPFDIWAGYPEEDDPFFAAMDAQELVAFLESPAPEYRASAASSLGFEELDEKTTARLVELAQKDQDASVRGAAWEALESAVDEDRAMAEAMRARLADASTPAEERGGLLVALSQFAGDDESIRKDIMAAAQDPATRGQAVKAMWHSADRRFGESAVTYLDDPDLFVRRQAIAAVGWLGVVAQLGRVEKAMMDEDLRDAALFSWALAAPGETSPAYLRKVFRRIEDLAGGLSNEEGMIVAKALDDRLRIHGQEPVFLAELEEQEEEDEDFEHHEDGDQCGCGHDHGDPAPHLAAPHAGGPAAQPLEGQDKPGRNDPCRCGSGKKYKKCCGK